MVISNRAKHQSIEHVERVRKRFERVADTIPSSSSGSKALRSISVGDLLKSSSVTPKVGGLIQRIAKWKDAQGIVEFGTCLGISSLYLAGSAPNAKVVTVEGDPYRAAWARRIIKDSNFRNIELVEGDFFNKLPDVFSLIPQPDLIFIDGGHTKEVTLRLFSECIKHIHPDTVIIIDDIRWSAEMRKAWGVVVENPRVSVSINLFRLGVLLFPQGMPKQHFAIRF